MCMPIFLGSNKFLPSAHLCELLSHDIPTARAIVNLVSTRVDA